MGFDLDGDGEIAVGDIRTWVKEVKGTWIGDANLDGEFNTSDLTLIFKTGEFEDTRRRNSTWAEGDWNGDLEFDTSDLVSAFQDGGFERGPIIVRIVPEPLVAVKRISVPKVCQSSVCLMYCGVIPEESRREMPY